MPKTSAIERNQKRIRLSTKHAAKRAELKAILANPATTDAEFFAAQKKLAKLPRIVRDLAHVIAELAPAEVVVEQVFVNVNPTSTLALGQARGAAIAAAVLAGLPVHEYTAGQIKQAVVGGGRAAKPQVQAMVARLLDLPGLPSPDAADALAAAVCHAHATTGVGSLARGAPRMRGGRMLRVLPR